MGGSPNDRQMTAASRVSKLAHRSQTCKDTEPACKQINARVLVGQACIQHA